MQQCKLLQVVSAAGGSELKYTANLCFFQKDSGRWQYLYSLAHKYRYQYYYFSGVQSQMNE
jgi:hypothetical protein